jgi:hypothetical protein
MKRSEKEIKDFFGFFSSDWVKPFLWSTLSKQSSPITLSGSW